MGEEHPKQREQVMQEFKARPSGHQVGQCVLSGVSEKSGHS